MQIRPTLVIGIGGSGTWVVRRLRKRLSRSLFRERIFTRAVGDIGHTTYHERVNDTLTSNSRRPLALRVQFACLVNVTAQRRQSSEVV